MKKRKKATSLTSPQVLNAQARGHLKAGRLKQAAQCYKKLLSKTPNDFTLYNQLGIIYDELREWEQAALWYQKAVEQQPEMAVAHYNIANVLHQQGKDNEALKSYQRTLAIDKHNLAAWNNMAAILYSQGRMTEALTCFKKATEVFPDNPALRSACLAALNYIPGIDRAEEAQAAKEWWLKHGREQHRRYIFANSSAPERILRVGIVSSDLRDHSVSFFLRPLLRNYDPQQITLFCYANVSHPDSVTAELKSLSPYWRDISTFDTGRAVQIIMNDRIDILIDLTGHMTGGRLDIFACQAAPLQMSWLGYPNTTGLPTMHYRITDYETDPPADSDPFYSETLLRLPAFLCYEPPSLDIYPAEPPCLRHKYITFGSLNNPAKNSPPLIELWAAVLKKNPGSRLLLKGVGFDHQEARERMRRLFALHNIQADRLLLRGYTPSRSEHLLVYNQVDIALDTIPYNGTTTTFEALWMGVPVITMRGDRHAARVGASIMGRIAGAEFCAAHREEYITLSFNLAQNTRRLQKLRQELRSRLLSSDLCQGASFCRQFENICRQVWQQWCAKAAQQTSRWGFSPKVGENSSG